MSALRRLARNVAKNEHEESWHGADLQEGQAH